MNIFLTGPKNCGKSTIIRQFLKQYPQYYDGFYTLRTQGPNDHYYGVYLLGIHQSADAICTENKVGDCLPGQQKTPYPQIFDTLGVDLLREKQPSLLIMDELGSLEEDSHLFQDQIYQCLDSKVNVLGVIQQVSSPFIDALQQREDVIIYHVTLDNHSTILDQLHHLLMP